VALGVRRAHTFLTFGAIHVDVHTEAAQTSLPPFGCGYGENGSERQSAEMREKGGSSKKPHNTCEDSLCQETNSPSERFFAFFPLSRDSA
jgi:hypothetical protein